MCSGRINPLAEYLFVFALWAFGAVAFSALYGHNELACVLLGFSFDALVG